MSSTPLQALREHALRLLARREHSRTELERKIKSPFNDENITSLLDELEERGLLSDQRFAESRITHRSSRFGNARMAHELRTQGVDGEIISAALESAGDELTRARAIWNKKFKTPPETRADWAKQARFLQTRGFGSDIIRQALQSEALDETDEFVKALPD